MRGASGDRVEYLKSWELLNLCKGPACSLRLRRSPLPTRLGDVFPQPRNFITHRRTKSPRWLVGVQLLESRKYSATVVNKANALVKVAMARIRAEAIGTEAEARARRCDR